MLSLLEMAYGSPARAHVALHLALEDAGRKEPPATGHEIIAFVRAHLVATLTDQVGPRVTVALLEELVKRLGADRGTDSGSFPPNTLPPTSAPRATGRGLPGARPPPDAAADVRVLLVDADRVGRTHLARALLRGRCEVTVVDSVAELANAIASGEQLDVALIDVAHPAYSGILAALVLARPDIAVVARSAEAGKTLTGLTNSGVSRLDVRPRDATAEDLVYSVRRVAGAE